MKIQNAGYIKLHRKFLKSDVHKLKGNPFRLFIDLLLVADIDGNINTSYSELVKITEIKCHKDIKSSLEKLQSNGALIYSSNPNLKITLLNWGKYQARANYVEKTNSTMGKNPIPNYGENPHSTMGKNPIPYGENPHSKNEPLKVPVQLDIKEYKNIFKNSTTQKNSFNKTLNILNPTTDLEKLIKYYLQLTNHPGFGKPNANDVLNVAVQQDIPNFEIVLANCKNVTQAAKCVRQFIQDAKGTYNLFYLPKQINAVRQKVDVQDRREEAERKRREEENAEYKRILAEEEEWARNHGQAD